MRKLSCLRLTLCLVTLSAELFPLQAQTTAFTFQGQLSSGTNGANGYYDLRFAVWTANTAGTVVAGPITNSAVAISNGLFTVQLDFGSNVFTGTNYWAEMGVRTNGGGTFATLIPRQALTPTPYAISALTLQSPQASALCPPGSMMAYMGASAPPGWLMCNGAAVSRATYAGLFAILGTASGSGDGSSTFNLPDARGMFLRGVDNGRGKDPDTSARVPAANGGFSGDNLGSYQADQYKTHNHGGTTVPTPGAAAVLPACVQISTDYALSYFSAGGFEAPQFQTAAGALAAQLTIPLDGGSETRPVNMYVNYIIKY